MNEDPHITTPDLALFALGEIEGQLEQALCVAVAARGLLEQQPEDRRDGTTIHLLEVVEDIVSRAGALNELRAYLAGLEAVERARD